MKILNSHPSHILVHIKSITEQIVWEDINYLERQERKEGKKDWTLVADLRVIIC